MLFQEISPIGNQDNS